MEKVKCTKTWVGIILILIVSSLFPNYLFAESYNKYVGQTFILPIPKAPVSNAAVNSYSYACGDTHINVDNSGGIGRATIRSYFSGTITIECYFQYIYYINNYPYTRTSYEYHRVTCISNDISITGQTNTLNVGESTQLSYKFSTITYDATPQVTWGGGNGIVSVSNGYVKALKPGNATITASSNMGGNVAQYSITVRKLDPTDISITTSQNSVLCDQELQLNATVYPSGASQSVTWSMVEGNSSVATLSSSGKVKGISPGKIKVKASAENGISTTKEIMVVEPSFTVSSTSPTDNSTNQSAFTYSSVTFSHDVYAGDNYSYIVLKNTDNESTVAGSVSMSGKTINFKPTKPLMPQSNYTFTIPANGVKNKWGTHFSDAINVNFKTGDYEKLTLTTSNQNRFLSRGDKIALTISKTNASIFYTLDGSTPTATSTQYTEPLIFEKDIKLRAIAIGDGYESSDILSHDYYLTNVEVKNRYPNDDNKLYLYKDVVPCLTYSNRIEASNHVDDIKVTKNGEQVEGEIIVADSTIFFVPNLPLSLGCSYKIEIPDDAITTWLGEPNPSTSWNFSTGDFSLAIAQGGELSAAIKTDGSLMTWGQIFKSGKAADGSYTNEQQLEPKRFIAADTKSVSAGLMHHAIIKHDGSLWMWGRQYCGELGNNSTEGVAVPVKIMDNVKSVSCGGQSTAIVQNDGTLCMVGRNDFGQIGDSTVVYKPMPVKIMEDVVEASAGWCTTYAITNNGTLYAWGRNDVGQIGDGTIEDVWEPKEIMQNVSMIASCSSESYYSAVIKTDGSLWVWGGGNTSPTKIVDGVINATIAKDEIHFVTQDNELYSYNANSSTLLNEGIQNIQTNGKTSIVLKENGSVWSTTNNILDEMLIEGRSSSLLEGAEFTRNKLTIIEGKRNVLILKPIPLNADYATIEWMSNDDEIVSVNSKGVLIGKALGTTEITATITDVKGNTFQTSCEVFVGDETGIQDVQEENEETVIYNTAGIRLQKPQKGINIVNGKKVLF